MSVLNIKTIWFNSLNISKLASAQINFSAYVLENNVHTYQDTCLAIPKIQTLTSKEYIRKAIKLFDKIIQEQGMPDIIHSHITYPGGYIGSVLSQKYNVPHIVTEHASYFTKKLLKGQYKKFSQQVLDTADQYTAVSSFLAEEINYRCGIKCVVVPNFIDVKDFKIRKNERNEFFNFINIAAMRNIKGIDILLNATKILIDENRRTNIRVHLIGGGREESKYKKMAKDLGIEKWCIFYGNVPPSLVPKLLYKADSLIISSRYETFGVAGIEAMAAGLPVISTNCGGPSEYINEKTGILLNSITAEELAAGMSEMMEKRKSWNAEIIRETIENSYSIEAVVYKILEIYKRVMIENRIENGEV